ncbi:MAG: hypothetical protein ACFFCS_00010 [Candidatus Hodarchaeota archaeon]
MVPTVRFSTHGGVDWMMSGSFGYHDPPSRLLTKPSFLRNATL